MVKKDSMRELYGKKLDDIFRIVERKYKDGSVGFFVEVTTHIDTSFCVDLPQINIYEQRFETFDEALECANKLKEEDKIITVEEETIHTLSDL